MKFTSTLLLFFLGLSVVLSQDREQVNYEQLLQTLNATIPDGQHRTLRDIMSIVDKKALENRARKVLDQHTFFTPKEINVTSADKQDLLSFYYSNVDKIRYSEILNAFFITPVEQRDVSFELKHTEIYEKDQFAGTLRRLLTDLDAKLENHKFDKSEKIINAIIDLNPNDPDIYLNILKDARIFEAPDPIRKNIYQALLYALEDHPDIEVVEIALQMTEGGLLDEEFVTPLLTTITNNLPPASDSIYSSEIEYYTFLLDSLVTLDDIRAYGYQQLFSTRMNFFQFPVDYYGKILADSDEHPWIKHNIINDLLETQHPRAFFYIVSDLYKNWKIDPNYDLDYHLSSIRDLTNVKIGIKNKQEKITFNPFEDATAARNFFFYWARHYTDYEWDENRHFFTNKLESLAKTQNYERLFRRLNSRNDTIAMESFVQLTEGEYLEIKSLAKKYRQLLRNQNISIPSLKYKYLEQLSQLTEYCRRNKIRYKVRPVIAKKLQKLLYVENPAERYAIENDIIDALGLDDITGFEYWACLKEGNKEITFSAGRILDWVYSKYWKNILKDKDQVRLFLKKSYLFEQIGVSGICNAYLNKFNRSDSLTNELLNSIGKIESDEDILNQISLLLSSDEDEGQASYSIDDFLDNPIVFNRRDIKILPRPTTDDVKRIVEIIKTEQEPEVIKKLFKYMRQHPDLEAIPYLFELIDDKRILVQKENLTVSVSDFIIPIVQDVYNHSFEASAQKPFATDRWRELWKADGEEFKIWEQKFFEKRLDSLQYFERLKIDDLNEMTESVFFSEKYKDLILSNLRKVKPIRNIRRLSINPKLSVSEDLKYFEDFFFSYKELDDIPKLFDITEASLEDMLHFLDTKSTSFEISEKGSFYNNVFRASWLNRFVSQSKLSNESAQKIQAALEEYLNESEFLSEFEEQVTQLNIAQLQFMGKSIQDKIDATIVLDIDNGSKAKILKSIIATIDYKDINLVISRSDELVDILGEQTFRFLSHDFGIPVFSFNTMKEQDHFIRNHEKLSEFDFYAYYLKKFGLDLFTKKGELDHQQIYNILRFDIVSPFVGETGGKRDLYIYGIIKLLELKYNTRLGFHKKLNESQTFYSFSSTKRAQAWANFLEEQHLVQATDSFPPSFNSEKSVE